MAQDRGVELRAVEMPDGTDPADILAAGGSEGFVKRLDEALAMIQFQVRRVLADAELGTPTGRDKALGGARVDRCHTRTDGDADELVREVADRLDVPTDYVQAARPKRAAAPPSALPAGASAGEVAFRAEREFLTFCLASGELGQRYLSLPADEQFSSETVRRARATSSPPSTTRSPPFRGGPWRWGRSSPTSCTPRKCSPPSPSRTCR